METMLSRFTVVSQGAIYLNDFIDFEIKPNITQNQNALTFPNPIKTGFVFENVGFNIAIPIDGQIEI
jgi:ATP-binding cassette subfamily B protein